MGRLKTIVGVLAGLLAVLFIAGFTALSLVDLNQYKPEIVARVKAATGRELLINGPVNLGVMLNPRITADDVLLSNAAWGTRKAMLSARRLAIQLELSSLLVGEIRILELSFTEPDLFLERGQDGQGNWVFNASTEDPEAAEQGEGMSDLLMINSLWIENGQIAYLDSRTGERNAWRMDLLDVQADAIDEPVSLLWRGDIAGRGVEVSGQVATYRTLLTGEPVKVDLHAKSEAADMDLQGVVDLFAGMEGFELDLDLSADELSALLEPGKDDGDALGAFSISTALQGVPGAIVLNKMDIQLGNYKLKGHARWNLSDQRPQLVGEFNTDLLDFRGNEKEKAGARGGKLFSSKPLDLSALRSFDAVLTLQSDRVLGTKIALDNLSLKALLEGGVLKIAPLKANAGGGKLTASLNLDIKGKVAQVDARLSGNSLGLGEMLKAAGEKNVLEGGATKVDARLKGQGRSVAALMGSFSGKVLVSVGSGQINNCYLDLAGADLLSELLVAVSPVAKKDDRTYLECAVANLSFKGGVAEYDKRVAAETDKMTLVSSGTIDLRNERLDIGLNPKPRKDSVDLGIGAGDLMSTARIQGSLANPELGLDAANTAKTGLEVYTAVATGGASLLFGSLFDKATADPSPCMTALGHKPKAKRASSGRSKPSKKTPKKAPKVDIFDRLGGD
ncbi:AsmA family protein [Solemya velesiana gill symbiont]|uniref:AsmA domain-containing protein n=1 Tax=Solemya velesiana gill symbiont TaxID=1918948 RepID=A0A1T2KSW3_9GAMM|nr:AsmA family protein [Solemya velesiana gill symbiont]OOZ35881.1 hypothetical protein BOW51_09890 [Solemya velesiana gill symbiont]